MVYSIITCLFVCLSVCHTRTVVIVVDYMLQLVLVFWYLWFLFYCSFIALLFAVFVMCGNGWMDWQSLVSFCILFLPLPALTPQVLVFGAIVTRCWWDWMPSSICCTWLSLLQIYHGNYDNFTRLSLWIFIYKLNSKRNFLNDAEHQAVSLPQPSFILLVCSVHFRCMQSYSRTVQKWCHLCTLCMW